MIIQKAFSTDDLILFDHGIWQQDFYKRSVCQKELPQYYHIENLFKRRFPHYNKLHHQNSKSI